MGLFTHDYGRAVRKVRGSNPGLGTIVGVFHPTDLRGLAGSALDHRSLPSSLNLSVGISNGCFIFLLRFVTLEGRSAHLAYHGQKMNVKQQSSYNQAPGKVFCGEYAIYCKF